jgi:pantothenate kinase-related protein Tda10
MHSSSTATTRAAETIIAAARRSLTQRTPPLVIALDGPSGSGKSTLAGMVAEALDVRESTPSFPAEDSLPYAVACDTARLGLEDGGMLRTMTDVD